ncbi:hypothetical protein SAMN05216376_110206 [Mameliella alba]|nr:hypothetical protein LX94_03367 [Mameliella alba]SDD68956.1 hypothetical protein SAMN05216376_110206 [Mameliella alba]
MRKAPHPDTPSAGADCDGSADPDLLAIRTMLDQHEDTQSPSEQAARQRRRRRIIPQGSAAQDHAPAVAARVQPSERTGKKGPPLQWLRTRARAFLRRPDAPRILSLLLLLTLVILKPGFVVFLAVMSLVAALALYFSIGPDRVQAWVVGRYDRLRDRDPDAADRLRKRAAAASKWLAVVIDKLPESWTAGLYLPDFDTPAEPHAKLERDPFERLARQ